MQSANVWYFEYFMLHTLISKSDNPKHDISVSFLWRYSQTFNEITHQIGYFEALQYAFVVFDVFQALFFVFAKFLVHDFVPKQQQ